MLGDIIKRLLKTRQEEGLPSVSREVETRAREPARAPIRVPQDIYCQTCDKDLGSEGEVTVASYGDIYCAPAGSASDCFDRRTHRLYGLSEVDRSASRTYGTPEEVKSMIAEGRVKGFHPSPRSFDSLLIGVSPDSDIRFKAAYLGIPPRTTTLVSGDEVYELGKLVDQNFDTSTLRDPDLEILAHPSIHEIESGLSAFFPGINPEFNEANPLAMPPIIASCRLIFARDGSIYGLSRIGETANVLDLRAPSATSETGARVMENILMSDEEQLRSFIPDAHYTFTKNGKRLDRVFDDLARHRAKEV